MDTMLASVETIDRDRKIRAGISELYRHGEPTSTAVIVILLRNGIDLRPADIRVTKDGVYAEAKDLRIFVARPVL